MKWTKHKSGWIETKWKRGKTMMIIKQGQYYHLAWFNNTGTLYSPLAVDIKTIKQAKQIAELYK